MAAKTQEHGIPALKIQSVMGTILEAVQDAAARIV